MIKVIEHQGYTVKIDTDSPTRTAEYHICIGGASSHAVEVYQGRNWLAALRSDVEIYDRAHIAVSALNQPAEYVEAFSVVLQAAIKQAKEWDADTGKPMPTRRAA